MNPRDATPPATAEDSELRRELERAYQSLAQITSRLLLANEAAGAALSTHDRGELSERVLEVCARGCEARRAALFLAEADGFSVGAVRGLSEPETEALAASEPDIEACREAVERRSLLVVDPELLADGVDGPGPRDRDANGGSGAPAFGLYLAAEIEDEAVAVLAIGERARGRPYADDDLAFLRHALAHLAVALNRSLLIEQNQRRLRELDALLRVSREITSTLDLDAVLRAVVNTVGAVVENERAEIALVKGGRLSLRAVSGLARLDPDQAQVFRLERPLEYLALNPSRLQIAADDLGGDEEPAGADVFSDYFGAQEMRSFMALPLRDDQGLLGFLCLESRRDSWETRPADGDALDVVAAQTTVAIRNARLYSEIPLRGVARPVARLRSRLTALEPRTRTAVALGMAAALALALLPVVPERAGGPARVEPLRFQAARAASEGVVARVMARGGEEVRAGQPLALIEDFDLAGRLARLEGEVEVARRQLAAAREAGDSPAWRTAQIQLAALERTLGSEQRRSRRSVLAAPLSGQVLELGLQQQVGRHLAPGETFCTVAALDTMAVELEVSEDKIARVRPGQPLALKVEAHPSRAFHGRVTEVAWRGNPDGRGTERFRVRGAFVNSGVALRPGMSGIGKATVGRRSLAGAALDPLVRAVQLRWW